MFGYYYNCYYKVGDNFVVIVKEVIKYKRGNLAQSETKGDITTTTIVSITRAIENKVGTVGEVVVAKGD